MSNRSSGKEILLVSFLFIFWQTASFGHTTGRASIGPWLNRKKDFICLPSVMAMESLLDAGPVHAVGLKEEEKL